MQNAVESASVQVLVAGIGSSPPQLMKKYDVVEIVDGESQNLDFYDLRQEKGSGNFNYEKNGYLLKQSAIFLLKILVLEKTLLFIGLSVKL